MPKLNLIKVSPAKAAAGQSCCGSPAPVPTQNTAGAPAPAPWIDGSVDTDAGIAFRVSTDLSRREVWEHVRCRASAYRNSYAVPAGLYAVGNPNSSSDVLVSANYKLSFDHLRRELKGLDLWILVLDTRGINVWCAAGKGSFGTDELIRRITAVRLDKVVDHRRIILPQLAAPGVSGYQVRRSSGFRVVYGPVLARDIRTFIAAGHVATPEMRTVRFTWTDRLVLTPMEINPAMTKYYPWFALFVLVTSGIQPSGIIFREAWSGGLPFLLLGLVAIAAGAFVTPLLLPFVPARSFAAKGWIVGMASLLAAVAAFPMLRGSGTLLSLAGLIFFPLASSYVALQFTGSTTFTGMSGVKKELRLAIPLYLCAVAVSIVLLVIHKLTQWGVL